MRAAVAEQSADDEERRRRAAAEARAAASELKPERQWAVHADDADLCGELGRGNFGTTVHLARWQGSNVTVKTVPERARPAERRRRGGDGELARQRGAGAQARAPRERRAPAGRVRNAADAADVRVSQ